MKVGSRAAAHIAKEWDLSCAPPVTTSSLTSLTLSSPTAYPCLVLLQMTHLKLLSLQGFLQMPCDVTSYALACPSPPNLLHSLPMPHLAADDAP